MAYEERMWPVGREDQSRLDAIRAGPIDHRLGCLLVSDDDAVPDEGDGGRGRERAGDLRDHIAWHFRPWETAAPGQRQGHGWVQMGPGN